MVTTVGQLLVNAALPPSLRDYSRTLDKKELKRLLQRLADDHPDQYKDVVHKLGQIGADVAFTSGSSFSLADLKSSRAKKRISAEIEAEIRRISHLSVADDKKDEMIVKYLVSRMDELRESTHAEGLEEGNAFSRMVLSGARGDPANVSSLRGADLLLLDHKDRPIPIPITHNYSEGLTPAEYFASAYGARKGLVATKMATADAGFLGKQLANATGKLIVTDEDPAEGTGLPVETDDPDNEGAVLARDYPPIARAGTVLTPSMLKALRKSHSHILVHSPISSGGRGISQKAAGFRERGGWSPIGDNVGIAAAQAISEPVSQSQLCLAAGTLVRMADWSVKAIDHVSAGEWVMGADTAGRMFPTRVAAVFDNGIRPCVEVFFKHPFQERRESLVATLDHKVLALIFKSECAGAENNWVPQIAALSSNGRFTAMYPTGFDDREAGLLSEPRALLLGLLLGDGCYTEAVRSPHFSCADLVLLDDLKEYLASLNLKLTKLKGHDYYYCFSQCEQAAHEHDDAGQWGGGILYNPAARLLDDYGLDGKYAHEKTLPDEVYAWDNASVAAVLGGLYVTDGSVYINGQQNQRNRPYVNFSSTSLRLVEQVRELLAWRFGIHVPKINSHVGERKRALYSVNIATEDGVRRFHRCVPLHGVKRRVFDAMISCWSIERQRAFYRLPRREVVEVGKVPTFDLSVENADHLFVLANGLIVSNSAKHGAGVIGASHETSAVGFKAINQLVQVPKSFQGAATLSTLDGRVDRIAPAPQGGNFVWVGTERHYVPQGVNVRVKQGDRVEAGDVLSDGIPNPAEVVMHKHIGEGRRYFMDQMRRTLRENGIGVNRRNLELLSRGLINHVKVIEPDGVEGALPDDIISYDDMAASYQPRFGNVTLAPYAAKGKYLEKPVLHFSIGTRMTPSVVETMKRHGVTQVVAHNDPPPFEPYMVRALETSMYDPDFFRRLQGFYIGKGFLDAAQRGGSSEIHGQNWGHSLARGQEFGKSLKAKGVY